MLQKLVLIFGLLTLIPAFSIEKPLTGKQSEQNLIARIKERYKGQPNLSLSALEIKLIEQKNYGPELADLLDLSFGLSEYTYTGQGIYAHARGPNIHSYPRHLCEPGVTEKKAEAKHTQLEPPSFVASDGTRHYAFMH